MHLKRAQVFYDRKSAARLKAQKYNFKDAIVMDFDKNLPVPNLTTSDVYYSRQLSFYNFNVHTLSNGNSKFYTYCEIYGKKGSDDVSSMLF